MDLLRASENGASKASGRRRGTRALGGGYKVNIGHGVSSAQLGLFIEVFLLCRDYMIGVLLFLFPRVLYGLPGMFSLQETLWSVLSGIARSASIGNSSSCNYIYVSLDIPSSVHAKYRKQIYRGLSHQPIIAESL